MYSLCFPYVQYSGATITCVLWEGFADELKQFIEWKKVCDGDDEPIVLALQFGAISTFQGNDF